MSIHRYGLMRLAVAVLVLGAVLGADTPAKAAVTASYGGTITAMIGIMSSGPFSIGDPLSIIFTYDETTADSNPDNEIGDYQNAVTSYAVTAGPYTAQGLFQTGQITVVDNVPNLTCCDSFTMTDLFTSGPIFAGIFPDSVELFLLGSAGISMGTEALPLTPPINDFGLINRLTLNFKDFSGASGSIQSLNQTNVSAVPVPAALPLFLTALAGLGFFGWRRRQEVA